VRVPSAGAERVTARDARDAPRHSTVAGTIEGDASAALADERAEPGR
jgi:hypothetical protein